MKKHILLFFVFALSYHVLFSQEKKPVNPLGITIQYGIGSGAIVDEYISQERYTGTLPSIGVWYGRFHEKSAYQVGVTFQQDDNWENYSVKADYYRVNLNYDLFYKLKEFQLFGKPIYWYFGPSIEFFEYELVHRFASNHKGFSEVIMTSVGINTQLNVAITDRLTANAFLRSNICGVTHKTHDDRDYTDLYTRFQTLFKANNINADIHFRYKIFKRYSMGIIGKAQYTRSTGWEKSTSFINSLLVSATVHI